MLQTLKTTCDCGCIQICYNKYFTINDMMTLRDMTKIFVHGDVTWNFCRGEIKSFFEQSQWSSIMNAPIIIHQGKTVDLDPMCAKMIYINTVSDLASKSPALVLLENSSGQGTEIGWSFNNSDSFSFISIFKDILSRVGSDSIGICIDTCHLFAAGEFNISIESEVERFFDFFDKEIGLKYLKLVHLNDSKQQFGKHVDRHANIGFGKIGKKGLIAFSHICLDLGISVVFETPISKDICFEDEFNIIRQGY